MRRAGFTLVEVLVALGVLAVGIGGVMALFAGAAGTHRRAVEETAAAIIADTVIAEQRALFSRRPGSEPAVQDRVPVPGYELYTVSLLPFVLARDEASGVAVQVYLEVRVHYMSRGRERTTSYRTVFYRQAGGLARGSTT
jgi:prepilin-type N-terminal cleavage/methylation domain-containing protein